MRILASSLGRKTLVGPLLGLIFLLWAADAPTARAWQAELDDETGAVVLTPQAEPLVAEPQVAEPLEVPQPAQQPVIAPLAADPPKAAANPSSATPPPRPTTIISDQPTPAPVQPLAPQEHGDVAANDAPAEPVLIAAVIFNGVQPGVSQRNDLQLAWGEPHKVDQQGASSLYQFTIAPFRGIDVVLEDEVVQSIMVHLEQPLAPQLLISKLKLGDVRPVDVQDEEGAALGLAFPERGVLFSYAPGAQPVSVAHILLEPIDALPFVQRAANQLHGPYSQNLRDLDYALQLDATNGQAHALRAKVLLAAGRSDEAEAAVRHALRIEPFSAAHRLVWVECLADLHQFEKAEREAQRVLDMPDISPLIQAQAALQLGDALALGPRHNYQQAIEKHMQAIKLAQPLTEAAQVAVRRQALLILCQAHLGVAYDVGWGNWKRKDEVVPKWIGQAESFALRLLDAELAGPEIKLLVAHGALAAQTGFNGGDEVDELLVELEKVTTELLAQHDDPLWRQSVNWRMGVLYVLASQIEHDRGRVTPCLNYGQLAQKRMEPAFAARQVSVTAQRQLAQLYFSQGAVRAVRQQDHQAAVHWYAKSADLLAPLAEQSLTDSRLADMLISMGVSYWQVGQREDSLELTLLGSRLLEKAVEQEVVPRSALVVPYGNLASMHHELGDAKKAADFSQLAERSEATQQK